MGQAIYGLVIWYSPLNISHLRYGYEASETAARCQGALEAFQNAMGGREEQTDVDSIFRLHGDRILQNRADSGLPFNIPSLDQKIGGLHPGELITVAARPKKGKTSLLASIVEAANIRTVIFSLELNLPNYANSIGRLTRGGG